MANLQVLYALTLALTIFLTPEDGSLVLGVCMPGLLPNALAEECVEIFAAVFEEVDVSVEGAKNRFATGILGLRVRALGSCVFISSLSGGRF